MFRTSESKIRHQIIEHNLLEAVIELPQNLFYGAAISTAILVFRKDRKTTQTLFMDARKGYISNKGIYKLSDTMVEQLLNTYKGFLVVNRFGRKIVARLILLHRRRFETISMIGRLSNMWRRRLKEWKLM